MRLCDIKRAGVYTLDYIEDGDYSKILKRYGFIKGLPINVLSCSKGFFVLEVLDSKYSINSALAKVIILK